ncbi:MAG TPA: DNA polymerase III subunit [Candidatus Limnocylindria bacterium]|jgi:DNA polymerase-3 subunit delta'|nr:DNA polymerase III subunit [Candidatus Limnocylindria bacterium]
MRSVIGQRRLLTRLGEQAISGDVAHGYELSGPRSIGKHTVAVRLAQTLNCAAQPAVAGGCGTCLACRKIERGSHPDVREVTRLVDQPGERNDRKYITIEQVREMQQDLALRPLEGRRRVVIIDDAADLSEHAEVALLKTLEEPPAHAVLLLVTPTPSRLLDTIRSRLQPLPFRPVTRAEIERALAERFGADAARFAAAAAGKPGIAISLATDDGTRGARRALENEFYRLVGSRLSDRFAWAADLSDERDTQKRSEAIAMRLVSWGELVRDAALAAVGVNERAMRPDRATESARLGAGVAARELIDLAQSFERWRRDVIETTVSARMLLELFALKLPYRADFASAA